MLMHPALRQSAVFAKIMQVVCAAGKKLRLCRLSGGVAFDFGCRFSRAILPMNAQIRCSISGVIQSSRFFVLKTMW